MQLSNKKNLSAKTLGVGKSRILFNNERLADIKEAITKQDIRDLFKDKAIMIKEISGTKTKVKRKTRRRKGSIKQTVNKKKKEYMAITRKLRKYIFELKRKEKLTPDEYAVLRKEIRARKFKSKSQMKDRVRNLVEGRENA